MHKMKSLKEFMEAKTSWTNDVDTNWKPKEGLFTWKDPHKIASYLMKHSKDEAQAMQRLVFYMNRAGDNLTNKTVLDKVKSLLKHEKVDESISNNIIYDEHRPTYSNMICVTPDDEILILKRSFYMKKFGSLWGFPGGTVEDTDKDSKSAAVRELEEETGIVLTWQENNQHCKLFSTVTNSDGTICDYWIVNLEKKPDVKLSREHSKYVWFYEGLENTYDWMPDVYQIIQQYYIEN